MSSPFGKTDKDADENNDQCLRLWACIASNEKNSIDSQKNDCVIETVYSQ